MSADDLRAAAAEIREHPMGFCAAICPGLAEAAAFWLDAVANGYGDATIDRCAAAFVKAWRGEP